MKLYNIMSFSLDLNSFYFLLFETTIQSEQLLDQGYNIADS
jgi:hypothetical protein